MGQKDITVKIADGNFNYRVGAIIMESESILMVKNSGDPYYYSVGGRVQFGESAREAVLREAFEETGIHFSIDRLAFIHENFFVLGSDGEVYHEIAFYFLMKPNTLLQQMKPNAFKEEYGEVERHWLPINDLEPLPLYPEFFKTELLKPTNEVKYFITQNEATCDGVQG